MLPVFRASARGMGAEKCGLVWPHLCARLFAWQVDNDMLHALLNSQPSLTRLELAACDTYPRMLPCFPPTLRRLQHLHLAG